MDTLRKINSILNHFEKCDLNQRDKLVEIIRKFTDIQFMVIGSRLFIDINIKGTRGPFNLSLY